MSDHSGLKEFEAAKAALLANVLPVYQQVSGAMQKVSFVLAMTSQAGPKFAANHSSLSTADLGISNADFNRYAQLPYDSATGSFGGEPRTDGTSVADLDKLIAQATAFGEK